MRIFIMCNRCGWEALLEECGELLENDVYNFAVETIEGIKGWVEENEHCTSRQKEAVINIGESVSD